MSAYQAQIDLISNTVIGISQTKTKIVGPDYIELNSYDTTLLGKIWNGETFETPVVAETIQVPILILSQLEFLRRFTTEERIAIRSSTDPIVIDFLHLLNLAQEINLTDADTIAGVNYCESIGLLTEGRAALILTP